MESYLVHEAVHDIRQLELLQNLQHYPHWTLRLLPGRQLGYACHHPWSPSMSQRPRCLCAGTCCRGCVGDLWALALHPVLPQFLNLRKKNGLHCSVSHIITMMFVWVKIYQIRSFRDGEYASYGIWHAVVPLTGTGSVEDITSWMFQNYML